MTVLKSTGSAFEGFIRDEYTTLKGTSQCGQQTSSFLSASHTDWQNESRILPQQHVVHWSDRSVVTEIVEQKPMTASSRPRLT